MSLPGGIWTLHHLVAACQHPECGWTDEQHGPQGGDGSRVLHAARRHARQHGHYVTVERGQHAHYGWEHRDAGA